VRDAMGLLDRENELPHEEAVYQASRIRYMDARRHELEAQPRRSSTNNSRPSSSHPPNPERPRMKRRQPLSAEKGLSGRQRTLLPR
jgi:hypothetical protein